MQCDPGLYSLKRGSSKGLAVSKGFECQPCPFGANCSHNIAAAENFWGFPVSKSPLALHFTSCPEGYCRAPNTLNTSVYNSCHGNREGVLCGKCKNNFNETLFSTRCRSQDDCTNYWLWPVIAAFALFAAAYVVFKPPMLSLIWKHTFWFTKTNSNVAANNEDVGYDPGYVKVVFYFYRIARNLMITSLTQLLNDTHIVM